MSANRPKFVNRWFLIFLGSSILGLLLFALFGSGNNSESARLGMTFFLGTGATSFASGLIWIHLYLERPSGKFCFHCGYDLRNHNEEKPTCPECGKSCISEYQRTGWRDTAKQLPGCLLTLFGATIFLLGLFFLNMINNGLFDV